MNHQNRPLIEPARVYSRDEAAEILNISLSTVRRLIASGQLRASQPAGMRRIFITGQAVLDFLGTTEINPEMYVDEDSE